MPVQETWDWPNLDWLRGELKRTPRPKANDVVQYSVPPDEAARLLAMTAEERYAERDRRLLASRQLTGEVTTGQQAWEAAGGRSPNPDELQRVSGGRFRFEAQGEEDPTGTADSRIIEVATGRRVSENKAKAILAYEDE